MRWKSNRLQPHRMRKIRPRAQFTVMVNLLSRKIAFQVHMKRVPVINGTPAVAAHNKQVVMAPVMPRATALVMLVAMALVMQVAMALAM